MNVCKECPKQWDCYEPCSKAIAWKEIEGKENRMPESAYTPKGIAPMLSKAERKRLKSNWDSND